MDAAQAILAVIAPVGAAALAFGRVLLNRHLRLIEQMRADLDAEREARARGEARILEAIESLGRAEDRRIAGLKRAVRGRLGSKPEEDDDERKR